MKKIIVGVFSFGLLLGGLFNVPMQAGATGDSSNVVEAANYSKTVTVTRGFSKNEVVPTSIPYNSGGWSGTLYQTSLGDTGDYWIAIYSGTVSCSGPCIMTKTEIE